MTRCVCRRDGPSISSREMPSDGFVDTDAMMIQCDMCNVWQHGPCVGIWADEEAPEGERSSSAKLLTVCRVFLRGV